MRLPVHVAETIRTAIGEAPSSAEPVSGGCINAAARVVAGSRTLFVKWNANPPHGLFQSESAGLRRLSATETVAVPEVVALDDCALVLQWIEPGQPTDGAMADAGRRLAALHGLRGHAPGLTDEGYIGTLAQRNGPLDPSDANPSWVAFFRRRRIEALSAVLPPDLRRRVESIDFEEILTEPDGGCALLHGDLWGGNLVCGDDGTGWVVDPAAYYGHPEVDLAMTTLFGGFTHTFYDAYHEAAGGRDRGLDERLHLLNLYPVLVHVHLFGGTYLSQVDTIARRYANI
jgi:protein-ribulosamine 3-kinase